MGGTVTAAAYSSAVGDETSPLLFSKREFMPAWEFGLQNLHDIPPCPTAHLHLQGHPNKKPLASGPAITSTFLSFANSAILFTVSL